MDANKNMNYGKSVIPDYVAPSKKSDTQKKKKIRNIILIVIGGLIVVVIIALSVVGAIQYNKYMNSLPLYSISYYDVTNDIVYDSELKIVNDGIQAEDNMIVSTSGESKCFLKDGKLVIKANNAESTIANDVVDFCASQKMNSVLYGKNVDGKVNVYLYSNGSEQLVSEGLNDIRSIVVSEDGSHYAYCTTWTYQQWEEDRELPAGGKYVTITVYDLYSVSQYGESKMRMTAENELECVYVSNAGSLIYNDLVEGKSMMDNNSSSDSFGDAIAYLVYNEGRNQALYVTKGNSLYMWENGEKEISYKIATDVEDIYYFEETKGYYLAFAESRRSTCNTEDLRVLYKKGEKIYYNDLTEMKDSAYLMNSSEFDIEAMQFVGENYFVYKKDGGLQNYRFDGVAWNCYPMSEEYMNKCGMGYVTLEEGMICYHNFIFKKKLCEADQIVDYIGYDVYYMSNGKLCKVNRKKPKENTILFSDELKIVLNYTK